MSSRIRPTIRSALQAFERIKTLDGTGTVDERDVEPHVSQRGLDLRTQTLERSERTVPPLPP